jgi:pSer/pThr/pTyr-binding forkhead associated (FHA) protein
MSFICFSEKGNQKCFKIPEGRMIIFGREEQVDFQISGDSLVSREHFGIEEDGNGFQLLDLGARNGTFLNERRLDPNTIRTLKEGDVIRAGKMVFSFHEQMPKVKHKSVDVMQEVLEDLNSGKGYRTLMSEIVANQGAATRRRSKTE